MLDILNQKLREIEDSLPAGTVRLIQVIIDQSQSCFDNETGVAEVPKPDVLNSLQGQEGKQPSSDTIRQRLTQFRQALSVQENLTQDDTPSIAIQSQKFSFKITISRDYVTALKNSQIAERLSNSGRKDFTENMGRTQTITPMLQKPIYNVFISHCWDVVKAHDELLDDFVKQLRGKLSALPDRWRNMFAAQVEYDRADGFHGRASFKDQMQRRCADSSFALFMVSNGWEQSTGCIQEATHFRSRPKQDGEYPYLLIQLSDRRSELSGQYKKLPNLPERDPRFQSYNNLIALWDKGDLALKEEFVAHVRDEICEYLEKLSNQGIGTTESQASKASRHTEEKIYGEIELDVPHRWYVEGTMHRQLGDDKIDQDDGLPAIDTLLDWACDDNARGRMVVLLGGFGMGKTTTVQLLHEALRDRRRDDATAPVPIYLDFRRLIPSAATGEIHKIDLADLMHASLHPDVAREITPQDVIDFVQRENSLVIFDGLDEVGNRLGREAATQLYRKFVQIVPGRTWARDQEQGGADWAVCPTRLILTCRTHFFRSFREQNNLVRGPSATTSESRGPE